MSNDINALRVAISAGLVKLASETAKGKAAKGEGVKVVRSIATQAAAAGLSHEQAGKLWVAVAKMENVSAGTYKPYTKHVQGFTVIAGKGLNLETGKEGNKPFTQADAVEAHKLATTPQAVLDEMERISDACKAFKLRIGGESVEGYDWKRPDADTVASLLDMLPEHPSEAKDVTGAVAKVTAADKARAEGEALLAELESAIGSTGAEPARTGTDG